MVRARGMIVRGGSVGAVVRGVGTTVRALQKKSFLATTKFGRKNYYNRSLNVFATETTTK